MLLFTRGVCDELVAFVFHGRSTYAAATSFFSSSKKSFSLCRQYINILGRMFVATLRHAPEAFRCPTCGDHPEYVVIDGQALGFRRRPGMDVVRPHLPLPVLPIDVELVSILPTATLRRAIRKILCCADPLNKTELAALRSWRGAQKGKARRGRRRGRANWDVFVPAAQLFFTFFSPDALADEDQNLGSEGESSSSADSEPDERVVGVANNTQRTGGTVAGAPLVGPECGSLAAASGGAVDGGDGTEIAGAAAPVEEPEESASSQWHGRSGACAPRFESLPKDDSMFQGLDTAPLMDLATALQCGNHTAWHPLSGVADDVGFVSNILGRLGTHLNTNSVLRKALGRLIEFVIKLEGIIDDKFKSVAKHAADRDGGLTFDYCEKWGGHPTHADFKAFAANHASFKDKDLDSVYS